MKNAEHRLIISFDVTVNPPYRDSYLNEGKAEWTYDPDGEGPEDPVTTQTPTESDLPEGGTPVDFDPPPPTPIPTLSEWAMILLILMLMGMAWRSRSRFGVNR